MTIFDHLGRKLILQDTPNRIISLVPSQTELLVDLGLQNCLVGITKFCVHPKNLRKDKTVIGGTKSVHFDKIKALRPDVILCNKEENTRDMVTELEKIAPVHVSAVSTISASLQLIKDYGQLFNVQEKALKLVTCLENERLTFSEEMQYKKWKRCVYLIWKDPYMAAGQDTFINDLLKLNKFENIIAKDRYPVIDEEQLVEYSPDVVLLSSEPFPFKKDHLKQIERLGIPAMLVDGEYFSWYGSRLKKAFDYFRSLN